MNKKLILLGSFLAVILMVTTPLIQGLNEQKRSSRLVSILSREKNTIVQTEDKNQTVDIAVYKYRENERVKIIKTFDKKIIDDIQKDIEEIEQLNITRFEKINLTFDIFIKHDILSREDKIISYENYLKDSSRRYYHSNITIDFPKFRERRSFENGIGGIFGALYGSFSSDYEDNGFLCLGYPFPFFNFFPMFFTGNGEGNLHFSGILEDDTLGVEHLRFDEFVSLFTMFFVGTVVLSPLGYFGYQGFMMGISLFCMGYGQ